MLKKRLIFILLYNDGYFMLSRNFRLQKVGDLRWLKINYNFSYISFSIDELIVLDITRGQRDKKIFCEHLKMLIDGCFVPISVGGGIRSVSDARLLLRSGADKIVINTPLYENESSHFVHELASEFGQQCIVAAMDLKQSATTNYQVWVENGMRCLENDAFEYLKELSEYPVGEILINSIDRDGTGQGLDMKILNIIPESLSKPVIIAGGVGYAKHLHEGLLDSRVDAVATAHLFNFVGNGLRKARESLVSSGIALSRWDPSVFESNISSID
ncbi:MAG: imidazole glycerol phosphate synthase subunit HisF [Oligoflexales bacterium]|nr:imidazole glycerol phosphate synthase subunit HisF [Oligoflexales bacterium]